MRVFSELILRASVTLSLAEDARRELEQSNEDADAAVDAVLAALRSVGGKAALAKPDGRVSIYTLDPDGHGYDVETVRGDFVVKHGDRFASLGVDARGDGQARCS